MPDERFDVSDWEFVRVETRGASPKYWLREPGGSLSRPDSDWLFKPATFHSDGSRQVGDWTETIASRIAAALSVPSAEAKLASRSGADGVILRNVRPPGYEMATGRMAMLGEIGVETRDSRRDRSASIGHSLTNVQSTLARYGPPPGADTWIDCTGIDVMTAYLFVDALIGNGDRHEQNWSVLRANLIADSSADAIAPSYDMEASLGFQLTDEARERRLCQNAEMEAFVRKGVARRFEGDLGTTLVEFAVRSFASSSRNGQLRLRELVDRMSEVDFAQLVEDLPGVSAATRNFALRVLEINRRRIHDAINR